MNMVIFKSPKIYFFQHKLSKSKDNDESDAKPKTTKTVSSFSLVRNNLGPDAAEAEKRRKLTKIFSKDLKLSFKRFDAPTKATFCSRLETVKMLLFGVLSTV